MILDFKPQARTNLAASLAQSEQAQLVRRIETDEPAYSFKHALVQDAAYGSLMKLERKRLHHLVGETLERLYPEQRDENAALLAYHFEQAEDWDKTLECLQRASEWAQRAAAHREQADLLTRAIAIAEQTGRIHIIGNLYARRAQAYYNITRWADARDDLEIALEHLPSDARAERALALLDYALVMQWLRNTDESRRAANQAMELAQSIGRADLAASAMSTLATIDAVDGNPHSAITLFESAFALSGDAPNRALAQGMEMAALTHYWLGEYADSIQGNQRAIHFAQQVADSMTIMRGMSNLGLAFMGRGQYGEALKILRQARTFGETHGLGTWLARNIAIEGGLHLELYDFGAAEALAFEAQELARVYKFIVAIASPGIDLLFNYARTGHLNNALRVEAQVCEALPSVYGTHTWLLKVRFAQARAELALAREHWQDALELADESLALARQSGRVKYEVLALQTRAITNAELHQRDAAVLDAHAAIELARRNGDPAMFLRAALTRLHLGGDDMLASQARRAAQTISASLPQGMLRHRFEAFVLEQL